MKWKVIRIGMLGFTSGFCIHTSSKLAHDSLPASIAMGLLGLVAMVLSVDVELGLSLISRIIGRRRDAQVRAIREAYSAELDHDGTQDR